MDFLCLCNRGGNIKEHSRTDLAGCKESLNIYVRRDFLGIISPPGWNIWNIGTLELCREVGHKCQGGDKVVE